MAAPLFEDKTVKHWFMDLSKTRLVDLKKKRLLPQGIGCYSPSFWRKLTVTSKAGRCCYC